MDSTDVLGLPYPSLSGTDTADVPRDIKALADAVEALILDGPVWEPGDLKFSAQEADHGRWLLCDGRELSAAEIASALSVDAGQADGLVTLLGTGGSSKYGSAASGKVRLPDLRNRVPLAKGSDHPLSGAGASGGAETITLTAAQSGMRSHTHGVTDPGHTHGKTDPGHSHGASSSSVTPTISVNSGGTGITAATDSRQPTITASSDAQTPTITILDPGHSHQSNSGDAIVTHGGGGSMRAVTTGSAIYALTPVGATSSATTGIGAKQDAHSHAISAYQTAHSHAVTIYDPGHTHTLSHSAHSHSITVSSTTTGLTINTASTGISINNASAQDATDAHSNMQPYRTVGSMFMRV